MGRVGWSWDLPTGKWGPSVAGAQVDYRIGARRYRTVFWERARICAMRTLPSHVEPDCEPVDLTGRTYD
jgi:hypothetical protein